MLGTLHGHRATFHHLDADRPPVLDEDPSDVGTETAFAARGPNRGQQRLGKARRPTDWVVGATVVGPGHPGVFDERRGRRRRTVVTPAGPEHRAQLRVSDVRQLVRQRTAGPFVGLPAA